MKHSFLFRWWYVLKLRQQLSSSFKMKNESDFIRSSCIAEIQHTIEPLWLSLKKLVYQLEIKTVQNNRSRLNRNEFGQYAVLPNPLFTQNQIARIVWKYWIGAFVIVLFITSESFLYYLVSSLFIPGGSEFMKISVAVFLALLIMFALDYGFRQHFKYKDMLVNKNKAEINEYEIKKQNDLRMLGYTLIALSMAAIISCGLARIFFLENIPPNGMPPEKLAAIKKASKWASILTMIVTIVTGLLLAAIKKEQGKISEQYHVYKYWKTAIRRRNDYTKMIINDANKLILRAEQLIEKHWQLVIEIKRIFKMLQEYDEKYEQLNQEYLEAKSRQGFTLNDHLYRKYAPLQGAYEELFRFGVYSAKEIREKIAYACNIQNIIDRYVEEQVNAIHHQLENKENKMPIPSLNGKENKKLLQTT